MWKSGLLEVLKELVLVEFLVASCILGLLWGFAEAFLFIHLGNHFVSFVQICPFSSHSSTFVTLFCVAAFSIFSADNIVQIKVYIVDC